MLSGSRSFWQYLSFVSDVIWQNLCIWYQDWKAIALKESAAVSLLPDIDVIRVFDQQMIDKHGSVLTVSSGTSDSLCHARLIFAL